MTSELAANTPILVGAGQFSDPLGSSGYQKLAPVDLAAQAARLAMRDAGLDAEAFTQIDAIFAVRTVADSVPAQMRSSRAPFGTPMNVPGAVAARLGANPGTLVYSPACGDEPQKLVGEICEKLHLGALKFALLCGGEAESTQRAVVAAGKTLDWREASELPFDDRRQMPLLRTKHMADHGMLAPTTIYPILEHARRAKLRMSKPDYAHAMGRLLQGFSKVAEQNPLAASRTVRTAADICEVTDSNRLIADPHTRAMVARDQVNLGAAVLLTTVGMARELGIDSTRWVFLHGYSALSEKTILERPALGESPAMAACYRQALNAARISSAQVEHFDIYSCFPIAVFAALDAMGLDVDDNRSLTLTGGLPFFGGPGNNYSMHAIAEMLHRLRAQPGGYGVVGANGGFLSTHAVGVYSTIPAPFKICDTAPVQKRLDDARAPGFTRVPDGPATVESYTVTHDRDGPVSVIVVGRLERTGERFICSSMPGDIEALGAFTEQDGLTQPIVVRRFQGLNRFALSLDSLDRYAPLPTKQLKPEYEHVLVERRGAVLEVTINRPEVNNALIPEANEELAQIFDAFEADEALWVAVITGAGKRAFCTGNDLKATAGGRRIWAPPTGFGGLTSREGRVKPVICAVNGFAMGGGFEIALACDLIVADETAQFALSEVRVGLIAGAGGLQRLIRQIPQKKAMEMILTGRRVPAQDGYALGFVNRIAPAGAALDEARALAQELLECSPTSIRLTKSLLNQQAQFASEEASVLQAYDATDYLLASDDFIEGLTAFAQKRAPHWRNR